MIIALQTLMFFRQSLLSVLGRFLEPYYKRLTLKFSRSTPEDEEEEEDVFAEFDDEKGVVFYPPVYSQRYAAVNDCLMDERWCGKLDKVVDLGYHDMSFIKYLKEMPGVNHILGVDIESIPLHCSSHLLGGQDFGPKREHPLKVTLFQGNAADPDYRLIGCDAVVAIEMIEHMMPQDLDRLVHTVFGFIKPWIAIITTPNSDFNVLFKALEKNGLRRLDHFFEWSREQFHDWCSNIVTRYPQFTVSCRGVGPGPPGTHHLGCCSQLALFINKEYIKQKDLNLNSLALVARVPSPQNVAEMVGGWESPVKETENILYPQDNMACLSDFLYSNKESCVTIVITPAYSLTALEYRDKTSQCNIDKEIGKNFLMFNDEEMCFTVLMPRRNFNNRIYEIEDVASRLNCTTFQVKKFSKPTQNLMAKNRTDCLVHTREVVDEIKHLTKMLNFNKETITEKGETPNLWCNINWGDNAPYWNQYYKIVKEYDYPTEKKSDESRILDLISDEINRMIDSQYDDEFSTEVNKMEIPIDHLMKVVRHITDDVDMVKDLLEWNGYEVVGDIVIHTRMLIESASAGSCEDWTDDNVTDLDTVATDIHSTSISDGRTILADFHGICLRRALDKKVRALRAMSSDEEDITTELDQVVCRLMKLALRTSRGKQAPPPARWLQCKLLDLLTLTEKAISRRKRHYLDYFPLKAIGYDQVAEPFIDQMKKENQNANRILERYTHLLQEVDNHCMFDLDFGFEDVLDQDDSQESLKDVNPSGLKFSARAELIDSHDEKFSQEETQAWSPENHAEDVAAKTYSLSDHSTSNGERYESKVHKRGTKSKKTVDKKLQKTSHSKISGESNPGDKNKNKKSKTGLLKTGSRIKSSSYTNARACTKKISNDYANYGIKSKRVVKEYKKLQPTASKPIPGSLIELCHPELTIQTTTKELNFTLEDKRLIERSHFITHSNDDVAATEESLLIDIIMDNNAETIALRRSIGTDADVDIAAVEQELVVENVSNVHKDDSFHNKVQMNTVQSQTIFLNDINEPSTSKGVRHVSMDVQCGTDQVMPPYNMRTPPPSVTRIPKIFSNGIKIECSLTNMASRNCKDFDFTINNGIQNFGPACSRIRSPIFFSKGIKIEDSLKNLTAGKNYNDFSTSTNDSEQFNNCFRTLSSERKCSGNNTDLTCGQNSEAECQNYPNKMKQSLHFQDSMTKVPQSRKSSNFTASPCDFADICVTQTPRPKSPDMFCGKFSDSLTNMLDDFALSTDHGHDSNPSVSPKKGVPVMRATEIKFNDLLPDVNPYISTHYDTIITDNSQNCTLHYKDNNRDVLRSKSPVVYDDLTSITNQRNSEVCFTFDNSAARTITSLKTKSPMIINRKVRNSLSHTSGIDTIDRNDKKPNENEFSNNATSFHMSELDMSTDLKFDDCENETLKISKFDQCVVVNPTQFRSTSANSTNDTEFTNNTLTLKTRCFGIKIKDNDENIIKKVEYSTTRVELVSDGQPCFSPIELESSTKTELLKPISSKMKVENSSSEFCCSNYCASPNPINITNDLIKKQYSSRYGGAEGNESPTKMIRRELSCGGIHIHSYKEKLTSEDIFFQGEWQRQTPKPQGKRSNLVRTKKLPEILAKKSNYKKQAIKEQKQVKKPDRKVEVKIEQNKFYMRNNKANKVKQDTSSKTEQIRKAALPNLNQVVRANNKKIPKVASKLGTSSITSKSARSASILKRNTSIAPSPIKRDCDIKPDLIGKRDIVYKSYLPNYLKKKKIISEQYKLNQGMDSVKASIKNNKDKVINSIPSLVRSNTEQIKSDLMKIHNSTRDITYLVFCNEINNGNVTASNSQSADKANRTENSNKKRASTRRSSSPISINSSTCSTPDSIATVMKAATKIYNRRHSISSNKSNTGTADSEAPRLHSTKNRKFVKRIKSNKKSDNRDHSNKENIPETSKIVKPEHECLQNKKSSFFGRNKKIFMAQFGNDSNLALNGKHQTPTKSNLKIPAIGSNDDNKRSKTATILKKKSLVSEDSSYNEGINNQDSLNAGGSNMVLLLEPHKYQTHESASQPVTSEDQVDNVKVVDSNLLTMWLDSKYVSVLGQQSIYNAIREIVEERLDFISSVIYEPDLETTNCTFEDYNDIDDTLSLKSYKTIVPSNEANLDSTLKSEIENAMNHSLDAITADESIASVRDETDFDMLSFKSVTSASRYSEYFLADYEHSNTKESSPRSYNADSVRDIFERKDLSGVQNPNGAFAVQAFSGFSMNMAPVVGEHQDYVNLVDSETGSVALNVARLATSEELFVSGRSSESYESCLIDDDIVVPNWLFNIISQQQSIDEGENNQELVPLPLPLVEPVFDVNGNVVEAGVGLAAGAGDGRGMHSDHSQDSSGRGSTLSSTATSSGQQSEAIIIDPSAFTAQFELLRESIGSSVAVTTLAFPAESQEVNRQRNEGEFVTTSRNETLRVLPNPLLASDGEADVSSLDTDVPDYSDD